MPSSTIEEDVIVFEYCDDSYIIRRYDAKWKEYYNECIIKKGYDLAGRVIHDINEKNCFTALYLVYHQQFFAKNH